MKSIEHGECIKLYGPRNFGKTSLARNIVGKEWESKDPKKRIVVYADLYSVNTLEDISFEISKAFQSAINSKKNFFDKGMEWMKVLKNIRPTWSPSLDGSDMGEISFATQKMGKIIDFGLIFESIDELQKEKKIKFLIILDEFQEVHKVKKAEAKLREVLQNFRSKIPVVILGSKQHMLSEIFEKPRAPFYSWGMTVEFQPIDYVKYFNYIEERFKKVGKSHSLEVSKYLQDKMNRIPESINRFCDYWVKNAETDSMQKADVDQKMSEFVDRSRSIYEHSYSTLFSSERKIMINVAKHGRITDFLGKSNLKEINGVSKSTVQNLKKKLLDSSVLSCGLNEEGQLTYWVTDPFFSYFIKSYKA